jgi:hypothetical protein
MNLEKFRAIGIATKAASYGRSPGDIVCLDAYNNKFGDMSSPDYGKFQKMACLTAARIFERANLTNDRFYHVFTKLATYPAWHAELDVFSDSVLESIGLFKTASTILEAENKKDAFVKLAGAADAIKKILGFGATLTPEFIKAIALTSAITGGVGGGAAWLLNRHSSEDDTANEQLKDKIDYYNSLSKEIKNRLKSKVNESPSVIKEEVENVFNNNNII